MNSVALADHHDTSADASLIERVVVTGDLSQLSPNERMKYYTETCRSLGLNPLTKPFDYLKLSGRLVLYARKDATDQLRKIHGVSITDIDDQMVNDIYRVKAKARTADGRTDVSTGAVNVQGLRGEAMANAIMKAETKAKRRVTLSICGLGMLDESETEAIPQQQRQFVEVDHDTGEIIEPEPRQQTPQREAQEPSGNEPTITDSQLNFISKLAGGLGFDEAALDELLSDRYGRTLHGLSKAEASSFIEHLQAAQKGVPQRTEANANPGGITQAQMKAVHAIASKMDMDHAALNDYSAGRFNGTVVKELTKGEASTLIDELQQMQREQG